MFSQQSAQTNAVLFIRTKRMAIESHEMSANLPWWGDAELPKLMLSANRIYAGCGGGDGGGSDGLLVDQLSITVERTLVGAKLINSLTIVMPGLS